MIGEKRFLRSIRIRNLLSFGAHGIDLELKSLNVLIGPNGSGKSNLIEAVSLLAAAPRNLLEPIQLGGGIGEWLWKGSSDMAEAQIDVLVDYPQGVMPIRHRLELTIVGVRTELVDEAIENEHRQFDSQPDVYFYYRFQRGRPVFNVPKEGAGDVRSRRELRREELAPDQSVLSQRKDPGLYPELTYLGAEYSKMRTYREWQLGRKTAPRRPQPTDIPADFLLEDASNLALVLNDLEHRSGVRKTLLERLREADGAIEDFSTRVLGGTIQAFLHYRGLKTPVPATRLSDGTIRYLTLLSVLCHPDPPRLTCIEEPEIGLHPDLLPSVAKLLIEASHRTQLIVTTHSDILVDALSGVPEAVVVCEKPEAETVMSRKSSEELAGWLQEYGLGQLWRRGELGGNRW